MAYYRRSKKVEKFRITHTRFKPSGKMGRETYSFNSNIPQDVKRVKRYKKAIQEVKQKTNRQRQRMLFNERYRQGQRIVTTQPMPRKLNKMLISFTFEYDNTEGKRKKRKYYTEGRSYRHSTKQLKNNINGVFLEAYYHALTQIPGRQSPNRIIINGVSYESIHRIRSVEETRFYYR